MSRIKLSEFPIKSISNTDYLVVVDGNKNYLIPVESSVLNLSGGTIAGNLTVSGVISSSNIVGINTGDQNLSEYTTLSTLSSYVTSQLTPINTDIQNKAPKLEGLYIFDLNSVMTSQHEYKYLIFETGGSKTYTVIENDGFSTWGIVTLRNNSLSGDLVVGYTGAVTLDGDMSNLIVPPKRSLQLVKADYGYWYII
jgi:hypothetical protein